MYILVDKETRYSLAAGGSACDQTKAKRVLISFEQEEKETRYSTSEKFVNHIRKLSSMVECIYIDVRGKTYY